MMWKNGIVFINDNCYHLCLHSSDGQNCLNEERNTQSIEA